MVNYLLDTNAVSGFIAGKYSDKIMHLLAQEIDSSANISIITQIELLSWKTGKEIEKLLQEFVFSANILNLNPEITSKCIEFRRKYKIKTPDSIIASTSVAHNLTLITENEKDFANIKGLKILNPLFQD